MQDQKQHMDLADIPCEVMGGDGQEDSSGEYHRIAADLRSESPVTKLLYLTPEVTRASGECQMLQCSWPAHPPHSPACAQKLSGSEAMKRILLSLRDRGLLARYGHSGCMWGV